MKHEIYIVGMGPGREEDMTQEALTVLDSCDVIVGYTVYLNLIVISNSQLHQAGGDVDSDAPGSGAMQDVL